MRLIYRNYSGYAKLKKGKTTDGAYEWEIHSILWKTHANGIYKDRSATNEAATIYDG